MTDRHASPHLSRETQLRYLRAYVREGTIKGAAHALGLSEQSIKNGMSDLYSELGVVSVLQALWTLGWVRIPND